MKTACESLALLKKGNLSFIEKIENKIQDGLDLKKYTLVSRQEPFAIIIGCSDARVPAEIIFDQGMGNLFVIRVAGNVIAPSQIGSVEFAIEKFGTPLVVVLGHSKCGAVMTTLEELEKPTKSRSPNLKAIVERIRPSVELLFESNLHLSSDELIDLAVKANIRASAIQLRQGSSIVKQQVDAGRLTIVSAKYCLESGKVVFFE